MAFTLPHLTGRHEELFDEPEPFVRSRPRRAIAEACGPGLELLGYPV